MNKDQVEGKVKDVSGHIERQAGEWNSDKKELVDASSEDDSTETAEIDVRSWRKVS